MINIRRGTFETNSSSMHSLVVVKNPKPYTNNELRLTTWDSTRNFDLFWYDEGNYGRSPFKILRTPRDKLQYWVAHELGNCERYEQIPMIKEFIKKHTGISENKIKLTTRRDYGFHENKNDSYGYVEHNDTGESPFEYIKRKGIDFEDFIMNPKYVVVVDGDEYQEFKKLFESNVLNADDFEDISTGADFWNDSERHIYFSWLEGDRYDLESIVDEINSFTKVVAFRVDRYSIECYDIKRIKEIIAAAKAKNEKVKIVLKVEGDVDISGIDLSVFDDCIKYTVDYEEE